MDNEQQPMQEVPTETQQPPQRFPNAKQKKILIYGGIAILLLLGALGYAYYARQTAYEGGANEALRMQQEIQEKRRTEDPTRDWLEFENIEYGYKIKYPREGGIYEYGGIPIAERSQHVSIMHNPPHKDSRSIQISVVDEAYMKEVYEDTQGVLRMDLKQYAEFIWKVNEETTGHEIGGFDHDNRIVGSLEKTTFGTLDAYTFTIIGSMIVHADRGYRVLDQETLVVFLLNGVGEKMMINFPNDDIYNLIFSTFTLVE